MDVAAWLHGLGLERYEQAFRENEIDWDALPKLTAEDLKLMPVSKRSYQTAPALTFLHVFTRDAQSIQSGYKVASPDIQLPAPHGGSA